MDLQADLCLPCSYVAEWPFLTEHNIYHLFSSKVPFLFHLTTADNFFFQTFSFPDNFFFFFFFFFFRIFSENKASHYYIYI